MSLNSRFLIKLREICIISLKFGGRRRWFIILKKVFYFVLMFCFVLPVCGRQIAESACDWKFPVLERTTPSTGTSLCTRGTLRWISGDPFYYVLGSQDLFICFFLYFFLLLRFFYLFFYYNFVEINTINDTIHNLCITFT